MASPKLQFGHDTNAVDAPPYSARQRSWIVASIRPRHQCRGCHIWHTTADGHLLSFNSATTPMPWMRCPGTPCPPGPGGFNSATTPMPWMHSWLQSPWASTTLRLQFGHDTNAVDATIQVTKETARQLLQFGHDTNAVDAAVARPAALRRAHASIRPRHQCRGCMVRVRMTSFADAASIRPRHQCRGCRVRTERGEQAVAASIRPRHQCRGCSSMKPSRCRSGESFNSATTPMPWMHRTTSRQRVGVRRFNSATTPMPWMRVTCSKCPSSCPLASIRPRHQCRGCSGFVVRP